MADYMIRHKEEVFNRIARRYGYKNYGPSNSSSIDFKPFLASLLGLKEEQINLSNMAFKKKCEKLKALLSLEEETNPPVEKDPKPGYF